MYFVQNVLLNATFSCFLLSLWRKKTIFQSLLSQPFQSLSNTVDSLLYFALQFWFTINNQTIAAVTAIGVAETDKCLWLIREDNPKVPIQKEKKKKNIYWNWRKKENLERKEIEANDDDCKDEKVKK